MWKAAGSEPSDQQVEQAVKRITEEVLTAAVATATEVGPWSFTAYVAFSGNRFWFTSQESTKHVAYLRKAPAVSVAMWKAPEAWGEPLLGLQLAGRASEVLTSENAQVGLDALHEKFPGTLNTLPSPEAVVGQSKRTCLFVVECAEGSVRDEANIGKGRFPIAWLAE